MKMTTFLLGAVCAAMVAQADAMAYPLYEATAEGGSLEAPLRLDDLDVSVTDRAGAAARRVRFADAPPATGTFVKRGAGWLASSRALTNFTGTIRVEAGAFLLAGPGEAGPATAQAGDLFVADGATLAIAPRRETCANYGMNLYNRIHLAGRGLGGIGALYNGARGVNVRDTLRGRLVLEADASTGGAGFAADFGDVGRAGAYALNGHTLTIGKGGSWVFNSARIEPGRLVVAEGAAIHVQSGLALRGDAASELVVSSGATFSTYNGGKWNAPWTLVLQDGAALVANGNNPKDRERLDRHNWSGPVRIEGAVTARGAYAFAFTGPVAGKGRFRAGGGRVFATSAANAFDVILGDGVVTGGATGLAVRDLIGMGTAPKGDLTVKGAWRIDADALGSGTLAADGRLVFAPGARLEIAGLERAQVTPGRFTLARAAGGCAGLPAFDGGKTWRLEKSADGQALELVRTDGRAVPERTPRARIGWITDTHIGTTRESCRLAEQACRLFRRYNVDAVVHNGDIADHYYPKGYEAYRAMMDEVFAGAPKKPQEIYVFAWHDVYEWNGPRVRESTMEQRAACYKDVAARLGIPHAWAQKMTVNGYTFLVFPQWTGDVEMHGKKGYAAYEAAVAEAEAEGRAAGKPVFVVDHVPASATVANSLTWGSAWTRAFFEKHPDVIRLSGHTHASLRDETQIWQGAFTEVNGGCLQVWGGETVGVSEPSKKSYGAVIIDVYDHEVVFRRFDVRDGTEYARWNPWRVPWPFDPATAPYSFANRRKTTPVPAFAADARPGLAPDAPFTRLEVAIPRPTTGEDSAYRYRVDVFEKKDGQWQPFKTFERMTEFYLRPVERAAALKMPISAGYFAAGKTYRVQVRPQNFFGVYGAPIAAEFTAPEGSKMRTIYASERPMDELAFIFGDDGTEKGPRVPFADGWYKMTGGMARLVLPAAAWDVPKGTALRFTVDLETEQGEGPDARTYNVSLMRFKPVLETACERIKTPGGKSGVQRFVIEFTRGAPVPFSFVVREGAPGKVRFHRVKVEAQIVK